MGGTTGPWNEAGQWPILVHMRGPRLLRGVHGTGTSGGSGCEMNWEISSGIYIYIYILLCIKLDFSGGSGIKNLPASAGEWEKWV